MTAGHNRPSFFLGQASWCFIETQKPCIQFVIFLFLKKGEKKKPQPNLSSLPLDISHQGIPDSH